MYSTEKRTVGNYSKYYNNTFKVLNTLFEMDIAKRILHANKHTVFIKYRLGNQKQDYMKSYITVQFPTL